MENGGFELVILVGSGRAKSLSFDDKTAFSKIDSKVIGLGEGTPHGYVRHDCSELVSNTARYVLCTSFRARFY